MRRLSAVPVLLALVLALALSAAACGGDDDESTPAPAATTAGTETTPEAADVEFRAASKPTCRSATTSPRRATFRLAYLNPVGGNEFLSTLGRAMKLETEQLGGSYVELDAKGDVDTQVSQFQQVVAQEVDGIFVFALDPGAVQPALTRAKAAEHPGRHDRPEPRERRGHR